MTSADINDLTKLSDSVDLEYNLAVKIVTQCSINDNPDDLINYTATSYIDLAETGTGKLYGVLKNQLGEDDPYSEVAISGLDCTYDYQITINFTVENTPQVAYNSKYTTQLYFVPDLAKDNLYRMYKIRPQFQKYKFS